MICISTGTILLTTAAYLNLTSATRASCESVIAARRASGRGLSSLPAGYLDYKSYPEVSMGVSIHLQELKKFRVPGEEQKVKLTIRSYAASQCDGKYLLSADAKSRLRLLADTRAPQLEALSLPDTQNNSEDKAVSAINSFIAEAEDILKDSRNNAGYKLESTFDVQTNCGIIQVIFEGNGYIGGILEKDMKWRIGFRICYV